MSIQQDLLSLIDTSFNEESVRELCFLLSVDYDNLPATGKRNKARELIALFLANKTLPELVQKCRIMRPAVGWPDPETGGENGDPQNPLPFEPALVEIPEGSFLMGSHPGEDVSIHETPQHKVTLAQYYLGKFPVTLAEYAHFIRQSGHPAPQRPAWPGSDIPKEQLRLPVVGVSWYDALAYCEWLYSMTQRPYRLPTEAEWEKGARGEDGRIYPWGNQWQPGYCNNQSDAVTLVNAYPQGASPNGCCDMIGNASEWTSTLWGPDWQKSAYPYPYRADDGRENQDAGKNVHRIFRGGDYDDQLVQLRAAARAWYAPDHNHKARGFRVALGGEIHKETAR